MIRLSFVLTIAFIVAVVLLFVRDVRKRWHQRQYGNMIFRTLFLLLVFGATGMTMLFGFLNRYQLRHLGVEDIASIRIGASELSDPAAVEEIVVALRSTEGYLPNHDSSPKIPFIIHLYLCA